LTFSAVFSLLTECLRVDSCL
jgi:hypothetical protein